MLLPHKKSQSTHLRLLQFFVGAGDHVGGRLDDDQMGWQVHTQGKGRGRDQDAQDAGTKQVLD